MASSMRWRLQCGYAILLALVMVAFAILLISQQRRHALAMADLQWNQMIRRAADAFAWGGVDAIEWPMTAQPPQRPPPPPVDPLEPRMVEDPQQDPPVARNGAPMVEGTVRPGRSIGPEFGPRAPGRFGRLRVPNSQGTGESLGPPHRLGLGQPVPPWGWPADWLSRWMGWPSLQATSLQVVAPDGMVLREEFQPSLAEGLTVRSRRVPLVDGCDLLLAIDMRPVERHWMISSLITLALATLFWVGSLAVGWWIAGRAIAPLERFHRTASLVSSQRLGERVDSRGLDRELSELAQVLNAMLDRLDEAFAKQQQFTADASHELRTPLAVWMSQAELALSRPRSDTEYRAALETCLRSGARMKRLIEDLLQLARGDQGRELLDRQPADLHDLAKQAVDSFLPLAQKHQVRLQLAGTSVVAWIDRDGMRQVLDNLLSNAIQYNRAGGTVTVTSGREGPWAQWLVSDTGPGIAEEHLPRLFDRFYRADPSRSRQVGGSGLGLAICRQWVEAHGGSIEATSRVGEGTTMQVRIPQPQFDSTLR
jgi:two-component system OmpR family sensor kinase